MSEATEETRDQRRAAVVRIVEAARNVAADSTIARRLAETTGLSLQGVKLALREHLETQPEPAALDQLVLGAARTSHVHVILSANVFIGALRALACARAAAPTVSVQWSSREPVFASALLRSIADPAVFAANGDVLEDQAAGEVHVYGRSETIAKVRARVKKSVVVRAHGPGLGVAWVGEDAALADAARAIANDVVPFDQRGCLSPRIVFVRGEMHRAEKFAGELSGALATLGEKIPRGALTGDEGAESTRYLETTRFAGIASVGHSYAIGVTNTVIVPPVGRHVHIASISTSEEVPERLGPIASFVTAVGTTDLAIARFFSRFARVSPLGLMQKPPFDGPVDLRLRDSAR